MVATATIAFTVLDLSIWPHFNSPRPLFSASFFPSIIDIFVYRRYGLLTTEKSLWKRSRRHLSVKSGRLNDFAQSVILNFFFIHPVVSFTLCFRISCGTVNQCLNTFRHVRSFPFSNRGSVFDYFPEKTDKFKMQNDDVSWNRKGLLITIVLWLIILIVMVNLRWRRGRVLRSLFLSYHNLYFVMFFRSFGVSSISRFAHTKSSK